MRKAHAAAAAAFVVCASHATCVQAADALPCKTIRIVAPNPPGGATDVLSRMIATPLQLRTGDIVVGDRDGLVVVLAEEIDAAIVASEIREEKEKKTRDQLAAGTSTVELLGVQKLLDSFGMG